MEFDSQPIISSRLRDRNQCRRILSQVCATVAQGLLMLNLGMMIAALPIINNELRIKTVGERLFLDDSQASWFGSVMLLCQPLGCVLSGCLQGVLGRKWSMILVNVPLLAAWCLLSVAWSPWMLYTASATMGVGIGFLEAPTLAYIGEVTEPDIRGVLATFANSNFVIGSLLEYVLGCNFFWRITMLISCLVPVITIVAISLIPESPIWLLTKGRTDEALSSLRWLRGWVSAEEVSEEFRALELCWQKSEHELKSSADAKSKKSSGYAGVPDGEFVQWAEPGFVDSFEDFLRPAVLKPLQLVAVYFFFSTTASLTAMRPYMLGVFAELEVETSPGKLAVASTASQGIGALACIFLMRLIGKRTLSLVSMSGCALCILSLGAYSYARLGMPKIPQALFCMTFFCVNLGIGPIPWLLISEVFPTRGRGVAGSVCAAIYYLFSFLMSITWLRTESWLGLHGCFFLYGFLSVCGLVYVFLCLPETEGKSLAEIEISFTRKNVRS